MSADGNSIEIDSIALTFLAIPKVIATEQLSNYLTYSPLECSINRNCIWQLLPFEKLRQVRFTYW